MQPSEIRAGATYRGDVLLHKRRTVLAIEPSWYASGGSIVRWRSEKSKDYFTSIARFSRWAVEEVRDAG